MTKIACEPWRWTPSWRGWRERGRPWQNWEEEAGKSNLWMKGQLMAVGCFLVYWSERRRWRDLFTTCLPCWTWSCMKVWTMLLLLLISTPKIKQHAYHRVTALWILLRLNIRWINGCFGYKVRYTLSQLSQAFQPWPLILLWNKRVDREIRKLVFIELLLRNKPFMSITSFHFLSHLFIWRNWDLERVNNWPTSPSQKMAEPEFRPKPYFVILKSEATGTWPCLPVIVVACSAEPQAPQPP